ncbi:MAG: restriction endonuclease subunit S [Eubacterium callanderi]|uniref:restriction endonuclease subunit S n=1 Tax=Eubacterium callanderi TaxID=53442 RepID=UPI0039951818
MSEKEEKIPIRRFKEFEHADAWEQRKLGEVGSVSMCRRIFKEQTSENGDIPFYKIGTFGGEADAFISREVFEEYRAKYPYPKKGDILLSASGSIGRIVEFTGKNEYFQDSNIVWLNHDERLDNSFLKCFYSIEKWAGIEGSTIKRLYNNNILNTVINLPIVEEQQKIGAYFANLDHLITLHQRKLEKIKSLKKAYLSEMFPAKGECKPKRRFAGYTDAWEQRKLGELADNTYGGGTPNTSNDTYWNGEIPWIQSSDLKEHRIFGVKPRKHISQSGLMNSATKLVPENSIAIITRVGVGKLAVMPFSYTTSQDFLSLSRIKTDIWFTAYLLYRKLQRELNSVQGTSIKGITKGELIAKMVSVPTKSEQVQIGCFFRNLDRLITLHQRKFEKLQSLKQAYLNEMFV